MLLADVPHDPAAASPAPPGPYLQNLADLPCQGQRGHIATCSNRSMQPPAIQEHVRQAAWDLLAELTDAAQPRHDTADEEGRYRRVAEALDRCLNHLSQLALWGPANRLPSSELWNIAGHLLARGWLQNQARTKPRGYAGDYEMLARIYEFRLCDDPLGRLFDRYFQEQAAPRAVRNRMRLVGDWIVERAVALSSGGRQPPEVERRLHIALVGSAFGFEVRDALLRLAPPQRALVHVMLLDLDPGAIDLAREQLAPLLPIGRLQAENVNLFRLTERPQAASLLAGADLLFCQGLFDYLDDAAAIAMLRLLYDRLASGGRLTIFQFATHNPTRAYMEWLGNWYLKYRDAAKLEGIVQAAGIAPAMAQFGSEPLGVDLYVVARRD